MQHVSTYGSKLAVVAPAIWAAFFFFGASHQAKAQVWVDESQLNGKLPDWVDPAYVKPEHRDRGWVPPVYRSIVRHHWCEPEYRTVCKRVWHEPVVETRWSRVWVPPRYEWRDDCCEGHGGELVLVEPGHYETCARQVVIRPGYWETVEVRELVSPGRYDDRVEQELVAPGHWE